MKVKLPPLPTELESELSGQLIRSVEAYALRAIREFVEGQKIVAWASDYGLSTPYGIGYFTVQKEERAFHHCPLIIKPELDDADR